MQSLRTRWRNPLGSDAVSMSFRVAIPSFSPVEGSTFMTETIRFLWVKAFLIPRIPGAHAQNILKSQNQMKHTQNLWTSPDAKIHPPKYHHQHDAPSSTSSYSNELHMYDENTAIGTKSELHASVTGQNFIWERIQGPSACSFRLS